MAAGAPGRINYLDGLRAVAITGVVGFHYLPDHMPDDLRLFRGGYVGVDVFLVLSGYLITTLLWRGRTQPRTAEYLDFLKRRLMRLYPALLTFLIVTVVLVATLGEPVRVGTAVQRALIAAAQGTQLVVAYGDSDMSPFTHTWTLGWEWCFYLAWPLVVLTAHGRGTRPDLLARMAAASAGLLYATALVWGRGVDFYLSPLSRAAQLLVGASLAFLLLTENRTPLSGKMATAVGGLSLSAICAWALIGAPLGHALYAILGFPLVTAATTSLLYLGRSNPASRLNSALSLPPITLIGRVSYSLYLWHIIPLFLFDREQLGLSAPALISISVIWVGVVVLVSYLFLEKPFAGNRGRLIAPDVQDGHTQADANPTAATQSQSEAAARS